MWEVLLGAILIAFGLLIIYLSDRDIGHLKTILIFIIAILCIISGIWLVLGRITLAMIVRKILGIVAVLFGVFMIVKFPDWDVYQPRGMTILGIFIGIIALVCGLYLVFF